MALSPEARFMSATWSHLRFGRTLKLVWVIDLLLYFIYLLDRVESPEYNILVWLVLITIGLYAIAETTIPSGPSLGYSQKDKETIISFSMIGFILAFFFQIGIQLVSNLQFKFSILDTPSTQILLGLTAAINEEVFRFSALRLFGHYEPHIWFLPMSMKGISSSAIISGAIVNTFWVFFHARSYVAAPFIVWASLWVSGAIITIMLYFSEHLMVAVAIHSFWNIAVVLKLATLLISFLGVG